jgi:hypothetical protein
VLVFIAVGGYEIRAVRRAIDADFAFGAAADGANLLALGGTEALGFALLADRTGHGISLGVEQSCRIRCGGGKDKRAPRKAAMNFEFARYASN